MWYVETSFFKKVCLFEFHREHSKYVESGIYSPEDKWPHAVRWLCVFNIIIGSSRSYNAL